jgi:nucleotide-binding universal stress UspA family protein
MPANRIIVGYDRSIDAKAALAWALDEATRNGAMVEILYAYEWPAWMPAASLVPAPAVWPDAETDQAIKDSLNEAVATARETHPAVRTTISIVRNNAALALLDRSADARLIVLGSRGHSAVTNLLGSVGVAVSAHARCPVVIVRGGARSHAPVVAGVDESIQGEAALAFAAEQAEARGVPLRLIRAWKPVTGLWEQTPLVTRTVTAEERRAFDELVAGWRQKYPELTISAEAVVDHPARALEIASHTAQLLVVGSRGRGSVRGMLLGSVSQHLLRHATCTVAVVHYTA